MKREKLPNHVGDLTANARNPRTITADALEGLKSSVAEFGDISGIVYNTKLGCLVTGHQRIEALKRRHGNNLKIDHDETGGTIRTTDGDFRVRFVEWDQDRTDAALLVANNQAIQGEWTEDAWKSLESVKESAENIFVNTKLEALLEELQKTFHKVVAPSEFQSMGSELETHYCCPKCNYRWSGKAS